MITVNNLNIKQNNSAIWSFAIHDGHQIDESVLPFMNLSDDERLREEDPFTELIADLPVNKVVVEHSRFQLDINRKIDDAIYLNQNKHGVFKFSNQNCVKRYLMIYKLYIFISIIKLID